MAGSRSRIVVAVQDPGAANCILPVVERLLVDGRTTPVVIGLGLAKDVLRRGGVGFSDLAAYDASETGAAAADRILAAESPALVLVGTSEAAESLDRWLTLQARKRGIPVVGILDHWTNYSRRFSGPSPRERLCFLPDVVCVMDEHAREDMIAEGFPPDALFVSGHPHLERHGALSAADDGEARARFRAGRGISDGERLLTFASETFGWTYDASYRFPRLSGSHERTIIVLEHVLAALAELVGTEGIALRVVNKLHPKNAPEEFAWIDAMPLPFVVESVRDIDPRVLVRASDVVVGMTSMLLLEAAMLGVPTLPVVPREVEERFLGGWQDREGIARTPHDLRVLLRDLLLDRTAVRSSRVNLHAGATDRVVGKIYEMIRLGNGVAAGERGRPGR